MVGVRHIHLAYFEVVGLALLKRKRIRIDYYARGTNQTTLREVSPQRMIYYRGNWYLDAWCHLRNDLRSFAVDSITNAEILEKKTKDVADQKLDEVLGAGYGIFAGKKVQWATLLFSPAIARWVSNEHWHLNQKAKFNDDGSYQLRIPYSKDTELVMDILRFGADVKVVAPVELVRRLVKEVGAMKLVYA